MDKESLWKLYIDRHPEWLTEGVTFSANNLRKFFDQAYDQGHKRGVENGRALEQMERKPSDKLSDVLGDYFKSSRK